MRFFLRLLILFAAAIGLAVAARFNPGNVVFFYPPQRVDLSLNFFLLLLLALFVIATLVLAAIRATRQLPRQVSNYRQQKRERDANQALRDALKALFEGRFGQAEKTANRAAEVAANASIAALIGARAAHHLRQPERRDAWLQRAEPDASLKTARLMTAIELLVDDHQSQRALDTIGELNATGARHLHALRLALKANQRAGNWPEVLRLVRLLDKHQALHPVLSQRLRELAYQDLLTAPRDRESLPRIWSSIPAGERLQPFVSACAARAFNRAGLHQQARAIVEKALAAEWDDRLVREYRNSIADAGSSELVTQIERCEEWRHQRPNDAELALTLGMLCLKQKLWGNAQRHLEHALDVATTPRAIADAHIQLAQLHEALNQIEAAARHYRQAALTAIA